MTQASVRPRLRSEEHRGDRGGASPNLRQEAEWVWLEGTRRGRVRPTLGERAVLIAAYAVGLLPADPDHSVYQWVEDGCPAIP